MKHFTLTVAAMALVTLVAGMQPADAGKRGYAPRGDYVVAESEFGNGRIAAPVRHTRLGLQVRLPGGSWIDCGQSCSETLRVKTVDFWQSEEGMGSESAMTQDSYLFGKFQRSWGW